MHTKIPESRKATFVRTPVRVFIVPTYNWTVCSKRPDSAPIPTSSRNRLVNLVLLVCSQVKGHRAVGRSGGLGAVLGGLVGGLGRQYWRRDRTAETWDKRAALENALVSSTRKVIPRRSKAPANWLR